MNRMSSPSDGGDLVQHRLQPLLELAAELRAGDQRAEVERQQPLVLQRLRHVALDDALRQALDDRGLADAGLADQHRVVLGAPRQHLDGAADLLVAADHRIELALLRRRGQVARILLQRVVAVLGGRRGRRPALADLLDRAVQRLRGHAGVGQHARRRRAGRQRQRQQQPLGGDELIARLLGDLLRLLEQPRRLRRHVDLAGCRPRPSAACRARPRSAFGARSGSPPAARIRLAASPSLSSSSTDRRCTGVSCWWLRRSASVCADLHEPLRALGELFEIHDRVSSCMTAAAHPPPRRVRMPRRLYGYPAVIWSSGGRRATARLSSFASGLLLRPEPPRVLANRQSRGASLAAAIGPRVRPTRRPPIIV